jgi:hypothetical protein
MGVAMRFAMMDLLCGQMDGVFAGRIVFLVGGMKVNFVAEFGRIE